jgi:peptidoglycan hydrolase-like protein with peptidoglycan-binding domain
MPQYMRGGYTKYQDGGNVDWGWYSSKDGKKDLQSMLKSLGYDVGPIDGKLGKKTGAAVKKFQEEMGLSPDGILGVNTIGALVDRFSARSDGSENTQDAKTTSSKASQRESEITPEMNTGSIPSIQGRIPSRSTSTFSKKAKDNTNTKRRAALQEVNDNMPVAPYGYQKFLMDPNRPQFNLPRTSIDPSSIAGQMGASFRNALGNNQAFEFLSGGNLGSPSYSAFSNYSGSHKNPMAGAMSYSDRAANYNASSIHGAYPNVSGIGYPMRMGGGYMPNNYMFGGYAGYPSNPGYANYAAYKRMQMGGGMPTPGGMPQGQPNPSSQRLQQMTGMEPMPPQGQPGPEGAPMGPEGAPQQAPQMDPQQLQQIAQAVAQGDERALQMLKQLPREVQQQVLQMVQQMKAQGQQEAAQMMYGGQMKKKKKKKKSLKRTGSMTHEKMLKQIMGK